jgi:gas vesicle protein
MKGLLKFLIGLALGFGIGYALGTLVPPEAGAEWRQLIRQRAEEAIAEGKRAAAEKQHELEERLERSKQELAV